MLTICYVLRQLLNHWHLTCSKGTRSWIFTAVVIQVAVSYRQILFYERQKTKSLHTTQSFCRSFTHVLKKIPASHLTERFITVFTSDSHLFTLCAKSIQKKSPSSHSIQFFQTYSKITFNQGLDRPDSSVGIATRQGLDGLGIEFQQVRIFRHHPDRP